MAEQGTSKKRNINEMTLEEITAEIEALKKGKSTQEPQKSTSSSLRRRPNEMSLEEIEAEIASYKKQDTKKDVQKERSKPSYTSLSNVPDALVDAIGGGSAATKLLKKINTSSNEELSRGTKLYGGSLLGGAIGGPVDLLASAYNLPAVVANIAGAKAPMIPSLSGYVSKKLHELGGVSPNSTTENILTAGAEALGGFGSGLPYAAALKALGKAPRVADFAEKTSRATAPNLVGAFGAGAGGQLGSETFGGDTQLGQGLTLLSGLLGGASGGYAGGQLRHLKDFRAPRQAAVHNEIFPKGTKLDREFIDAGRALEEQTGVDLTAGQLTGEPSVLAKADAYANAGEYQGNFAKKQKQQTDQLLGQHNELVNEISPESMKSPTFGKRLVQSFKNTLENLADNLKKTGDADFAAVDKASKGKNNISLQGTAEVFEKLAAEKNSPLVSELTKKQSEKIAVWGRRIQNAMKNGGGFVSGSAVSALLTDLTSGLGSKGNFFKGLEGAADTRITRLIKEAVLADLEHSAQHSKNPEAAQAILKARETYYNNFQKIREVQDATITKAVGKSADSSAPITGQDVAESFGRMHPEEIHVTMELLKEANPDLLRDTQRHMLENAVDQASATKGQYGSSALEAPFNGKTFLEKLPNNEVLRLIYGENLTKGIKKIAQTMDRVVRLGTSKGGSPTASRAQGLLTQLKNAISSPLGFIVEKIVGTMKNPDVVVDILLNKDSRDKAIRRQIRKEDLAARDPSASGRLLSQQLRYGGTEKKERPVKK